MKSKDKILNETYCKMYSHGGYKNSALSKSYSAVIFEAMGVFAKQQSIEFDKWWHKDGWLYNEGYYYQPNESTPFLTAEQLYEKFIESELSSLIKTQP